MRAIAKVASAGAVAKTRRRHAARFAEARAAAFTTLSRWLQLERERGRLLLGLPVAFAVGILLYFNASDEPYAPVVAVVTLIALAACFTLRAHPVAFPVATAFSAVLSGFAIACLKTALLAHPVLSTEPPIVTVTGFVEAIEARATGDRLTVQVKGLAPAIEPAIARIRVVARLPAGVKTGAAISFRARLRPPAEPALPGSYDFAKDAYFQGIGATGFVLGKITPIDLGPVPTGVAWRTRLETVRSAISDRIRQAIPGSSGAIADALVTGRRDGIPDDINQAMRASGLYHILSISGFHMALVAALIFAAVRGGLSLVPGLALRHPVKAYAALVALAVATVYLVISGAEVATQRSWVMITIVLIAVSLNRTAVTLRTLALAALGVLILSPESLLGPSFQMSFAATLALVSGYTLVRPFAEGAGPGSLGRAFVALSQGVTGLAASSFLASIATMPFAAYHFNTVQLYGVPGNLLGAPIVEFITMPLEILALLAWPFGFDRPIWALAGSSIDLFVATARWVASWPGGQWPLAAFGAPVLIALTAGYLILTLFSTPLRYLGVPLLVGSLGAIPFAERPLVMIDADGTSIAARGLDGRLILLTRQQNRFALARWLEADGDLRKPGDESLTRNVLCDPFGCAAELFGGGRIAVATRREAVADDCTEAGIVITRHPAPPACKALVIRLDALAWTGAVTIHGQLSAPRIVTTRDPSGMRPWYRPRPDRAIESLRQLPQRPDTPAPLDPVPDEDGSPDQ